MKTKIFNLSKIFILSFVIVSLVICCGCKKEENPYENKVCIECGEQASNYISGPKPLYGKANKNNSEEITSSVYRLFYCDDCMEKLLGKVSSASPFYQVW